MLKLRWGASAFAVAAAALALSLAGTGAALTQASAAPATHQAGPAVLPSWHTLTLTGGWVYGGFGSYQAAWYKDAQHVVHLRGSAKFGNSLQPVFQLPAGARPANAVFVPVYAANGSFGGLWIKPDGHAQLFDSTGTNKNVHAYASLDGVSFRVP